MQMRFFALLLAAVGGIAGVRRRKRLELDAPPSQSAGGGLPSRLGRKRGACRSQFLTKAVTLSLIGGVAGIALAAWKAPLREGRLLLLSCFPDNIRRPTRRTATQRNATP